MIGTKNYMLSIFLNDQFIVLKQFESGLQVHTIHIIWMHYKLISHYIYKLVMGSSQPIGLYIILY